jgi:hypothetical protein
MGASGSGGMNVALLFFGCRCLRIIDRWESTPTLRVEASTGEVRSLDGREVVTHLRLPVAASGDLGNGDDEE